jgi:hypothetical protein
MRRLVVLALACGGASKATVREAADFQCHARIASYVAAHHLGADELGVQIDCANGPEIKRWIVDRQGNRKEDSRSLTPAEFEQVWRQIAGTGWENLHDCTNGTGGKQDPVYQFDIKDDQNKASFTCQSRSMPYPYHDIVDPLDAMAAKGRKDLNGE